VTVPGPQTPDLDPPANEVEAWLYEHAPPERLESARALYELMPSQSNRQLPFVYMPYNAASEAHWADAARIADYAAAMPPGAMRVLDIGPGDGWPSLPLAAARPEIEVVGLDPSPVRARVCVANAKRLALANAHFLDGDAARLPFADASFDGIVAANSLEEAAEPTAVFAELARVLRPGGVLRVSYQDWRLDAPEFATVHLWGGRQRGERVLLYSYSRRVQQPAVERRYTLVLPAEGPAEHLHSDALMTAALAPRAYGETLLEGPWAALGVPLLRHLAPHARRSTVVELQRWTTAWLVEALLAAGFSVVRGTAHPGELARERARELLEEGGTPAAQAQFEAETVSIGWSAASQDGDEMVIAVR
jgi:SAM-dependent methyltransferase